MPSKAHLRLIKRKHDAWDCTRCKLTANSALTLTFRVCGWKSRFTPNSRCLASGQLQSDGSKKGSCDFPKGLLEMPSLQTVSL